MVRWLCIELSIGMVWVQTLVNPNLTSFLLNISCGLNVKRQRKLSRQNLGGDMVLCVCLLNCNRSVVNSCICDQSNELA